ncbi:MAG: CdaR family protein [Zetaproteobacteria bacterium]|nr:CdaR family protein [Zetaproteobacteria bacterium]
MILGILNNWRLKLLAVFLSATFWYLIQAEEVLELNRKIHVHVHVVDGYLVKGSSLRIKDATLSGPRAMLSEFSNQPIDAHIHIPKGKVGELRFRVDREYIPGWNSRVKLTVHDAYLVVVVGEEFTKTVPIQEQIQGTPADGFIVEKTSLDPPTVDVSGLRVELAKVTHISTTTIDVDQLRESTTTSAALVPPEGLGVKLASYKVDVDLKVGEKKVNRRFFGIPVEVEGQSQNLEFYPKNVSIELQGTPGVLNLVEARDLKAFINVEDLPVGKHVKSVQVRIPSDTVLIETSPDSVQIVIQKLKKQKI